MEGAGKPLSGLRWSHMERSLWEYKDYDIKVWATIFRTSKIVEEAAMRAR